MPRSSEIFNLTFDAADPRRLAEFWALALGYQVEPPPDGFGSWEEALAAWNVPEDEWDRASAIIDPRGVLPRVFFQKVPESKAAKNRVHLDVRSWRYANSGTGSGEAPPEEERRAAAEAKVAAGASVVTTTAEFGNSWTVMLDPEGNEFCVT